MSRAEQFRRQQARIIDAVNRETMQLALRGSVYVAPVAPRQAQALGLRVPGPDELSAHFLPGKIVGPGFELHGDGRVVLGFDGSRSDDALTVAWRDPRPLTLELKSETINSETLRLLTGGRITITKEIHMTTIDRKNFVGAAVNVPAASLAHRHLGSLVTITLPSGAEVTDVLSAVAVGSVQHGGVSTIKVYLQNVQPDHLNGGFQLDPKGVVKVRRPKPAPAAKKTRR